GDSVAPMAALVHGHEVVEQRLASGPLKLEIDGHRDRRPELTKRVLAVALDELSLGDVDEFLSPGRDLGGAAGIDLRVGVGVWRAIDHAERRIDEARDL